MSRGVVKFYSWPRRYGFIQSSDLQDEIFCGEIEVHLPPGVYLQKGDEVTFDIGQDKLGRPRAENVKRVAAAPAVEQPLAPNRPHVSDLPVAHDDTTPYIDVPGKPRRYFGRTGASDPTLDDRARRWAAAEAVFRAD